jgi:hypothetical protein
MSDATCAELRVERDPSLLAMVQAVTDGITAARARGASRLLVDLSALAGVAPPSLGQRDALITAWARAAAGELVVAVVAPKELLDPERFGVYVAEAAGMRAEAFVDEVAARAWLQRQRDPRAVAPSLHATP